MASTENDQTSALILQEPEVFSSWLSQFSESERGDVLNDIGTECLEKFKRTGLTDYLLLTGSQ